MPRDDESHTPPLEENTWHQAVQDVTPLSPREKIHFKEPKRTENTPSNTPSTLPFKPHATRQETRPPQKERAPHTVPAIGDMTALDRQTAKQFAAGNISPNKVLDLHGMTQSEAHQQIQAMLQHAHQQQWRSVHIITGKGSATPGGRGVLRQAVPQWLQQHQAPPIIRAISYLPPAKGGDGVIALYFARVRTP